MSSRRFVKIILFRSGTLSAVSTLVWSLIPYIHLWGILHPKYFVSADAPLLAKPVQDFSPELSTSNPAALKSARTGLHSVDQQKISDNECAALDEEQREELTMESHKWDEARKYEQEAFTFDDDAAE
jgi:hypothetical protein